MSSEMVERVARAIAWAELPDYAKAVTTQDGMYVDPSYSLIARAAIEAMREPTDEMLIAGTPWYHDNWRKAHVREDTSMEAIWQAMLDAALT